MQYRRSTCPLSSIDGSSREEFRPFSGIVQILIIPSSHATARVSVLKGSHWKSDIFDLLTRLKTFESESLPGLSSFLIN